MKHLAIVLGILLFAAPSWASPTFIAKNCVVCTTNAGCPSNPGPTVTTPPTGTQNGDLLLGILFSNGSTNLALSGFTLVNSSNEPACGDGSGGSSAGALQIFAKTASNETGPYTVTLGPASYYTFCMATYRGATITTDGHSSNSNAGPSASPVTPSFTTAFSGDLLLTFYCDSSSSTTTLSGLPGTQRNLNTPGINSQNFTNGWSDQVLGLPGTVPAQSATLSASDHYGSFAQAFGAGISSTFLWPFP